MKIINILDGLEINDPDNLQDTEIEINFEPNGTGQISTTRKLEFGDTDITTVANAYKICKQRLNQGTTNGRVGVEEGVEFIQLLVNELGTTHELTKGYVDLWGAEYNENTVIADVVDVNSNDWLNDNADSFTFEYLESIGLINSSHFVMMPYCINKSINYLELAITTLSVFYVRDKIEDNIQKLSSLVAELANPLEFTAIARLVLLILYTTVLIIALIKLIYDLVTMLIQPVKYLACMYYVDMLRIGCKYLGINYSSSILDQYPYVNMVYIPEKYNQNLETGVLGVIGNLSNSVEDNKGYFKGTFGEFLQLLKTIFYAKIIVSNNTLYLEKNNFTLSAPIYQLPNLMDSKFIFSLNKDEFYSNIHISFAYSLDDENTIQNWTGNNLQVFQTQIITDNKRFRLGKNLLEIRIPVSRASRKTELSAVESVLDVFFKTVGVIIDALVTALNLAIEAANLVISVINGILSALEFIGIDLNANIPSIPTIEIEGFSNLIENRIDMMVLSSDYMTTPKSAIINRQTKKLDPNNELFLSARYIWDNFYYLISFVESDKWSGNQYLIRDSGEIPFTISDYEKVKRNSRIFDGNGNEAIVLSLKYQPLREVASIRYKTQQKYITNLKEVIVEPNGK